LPLEFLGSLAVTGKINRRVLEEKEVSDVESQQLPLSKLSIPVHSLPASKEHPLTARL